jgi:hypothetical protein
MGFGIATNHFRCAEVLTSVSGVIVRTFPSQQSSGMLMTCVHSEQFLEMFGEILRSHQRSRDSHHPFQVLQQVHCHILKKCLALKSTELWKTEV